MGDLRAHTARVRVRLCMCARPNAHTIPAAYMRPTSVSDASLDAIDATDIAVLWMPSCLALPERLVIGSDGASIGVKSWLRKQARMSGLLNSTTTACLRVAKVGRRRPIAHSGMQAEESESRFTSQAFYALLRDKTRGMAVRNAGIVGGRRAVFERALSTVVDRMRGLTDIGDMVCAAPCHHPMSPGLQPYASKPASPYLQAHSLRCPSLQPHASKPAAMCLGLQPHVPTGGMERSGADPRQSHHRLPPWANQSADVRQAIA